jgi:shikimate kinase
LDRTLLDKPIVLIGFMGTGKSTVCRLLAERLGWSWKDTDEEIERREGRSIPDIFAESGEPAFRAIETQVLADLLDTPKIVLATGGGAVLAEANRQAMLEKGYVVALKAEREQIVSRVRNDPNRPLLQGDVEGNVARLLAARQNAYDFAHLTVDTTHLSAEAVVERIAAARLEAAGNAP